MKKWICIGILLFGAAAELQAAPNPERNFYAGFNLGLSRSFRVESSSGLLIEDDGGYLHGVQAGWQFTPHWSVELGYSKLEDIDLIIVRGDDIQFFQTWLQARYTQQLGQSDHHLSFGAGVSHWRLRVESRFEVVGIDVGLDDPERNFSTNGRAASGSLTWGWDINEVIVWDILALNVSHSDSARWTFVRTAFNFRF